MKIIEKDDLLFRYKLIKIAKDFRDGLLDEKKSNGMCYMVCAALAGYLNFEGYHTELMNGEIEGSEHYWIVIDGGIIIDPTADQFTKPDGSDMPPVYVGEKPSWYE